MSYVRLRHRDGRRISIHDGYLDLRAYPKGGGRWACGFVSTGMDGRGNAGLQLHHGLPAVRRPGQRRLRHVAGPAVAAEHGHGLALGRDRHRGGDQRPPDLQPPRVRQQAGHERRAPGRLRARVARLRRRQGIDHITFTMDGEVIGRWNGSMPDPMALLAD